MTKKKLFTLSAAALMVLGAAVSCGGNTSSTPSGTTSTGEIVKPADNASTKEKVAYAETRTYEELVELAKEEMNASNDTFKVLGLTSALKKAVTQLIDKYDFLTDKNTYVNNGYKDYTLLTALEPAENTYVADFALTQDERSIADYHKSNILVNFVPKDYKECGLSESATKPLQGIHFNKIFWTNKNFTNVTGLTLHNIWQMAGGKYDSDNKFVKDYSEEPVINGKNQHISKVSFQSPVTEQINMSFLVSCYADKEQNRIKAAYKDYYGKDWAPNHGYKSAGEQWVAEFVNNISNWHKSDGDAMKTNQLSTDWNSGYVYYGAYAKMKDAAGKYYTVEGQATDPILKDLVIAEGENKGKINAMQTVKWDWEIKGFNGFFYTMDSQIVNNAKHPYTACLFARYLLEPDFYTNTIYGSSTPNENGTKGNQYGYYFPGRMDAYGTEGAKVTTNSFDWTKDKWQSISICEDYSYLSTVRAARVASIQALVAAASK